MRRAALLAAGTVAVGCGLSITGAIDPNGESLPPPSSATPPAPDAREDASSIAEAGPLDADADSDAEIACVAPRTCQPIPASWNVVALVASRAAGSGGFAPGVPCPAGFGSPRVGFAAPRSTGAACTCACGAFLADPCKSGSLVLQTANNPGACNDTTLQPSPDGACRSAQTSGLSSVVNIQGAVTPVGTTCAATATLPAILDDGAFALCDLTSTVDACSGGACIDPPAGAKICLVHDGDVACPDTTDAKTLVTPQTNLVEGRSCVGSCDCQSTATSCSGTLDLYADTVCGADKFVGSTTLDNGCNPLPGTSATPRSYRIGTTPNTLGCVPRSPSTALLGTLTSGGSLTMCCR